MKKPLVILALLTATAACAQDANRIAFFEKKIRPVLAKHCYKCHASDAKSIRGGLLLDTRVGIRKGGDSGPAVVPKKLDESLLISSLKYEDYEMPPSGKLPDSVIADFEKWIAMGAPDPRDGNTNSGVAGIDIEAGRKFWAFQQPKVHAVPQVQNEDWPNGDIDRFTQAAMENAGLVPAANADKRTLLRRAYFDLIGLPPSPAAIDAFLEDESAHAYESVIDELLASSHFGERWGRHWMDVARYSDSTGGGRSLLFKVAWRYRNYVIDAFNRDTPFDEFITEQIAGDLMSSADQQQRARQLTATGFLALGPTNYENQDKRQLRMDVIDEQIDTIGRAFLGMTIGCARCHDHKFDPIPTTDYYALAGIFRSTRTLIDGNVSSWITRPLPDGTGDRATAEDTAAELDLKTKLGEKRKRLAELRTKIPSTTIDDDEARLVGMWTDSTFVKGFVGRRYVHTNDRNARATFAFTAANTGRHQLFASHTEGTNREAATPIVIRRNGKEVQTVRIDQRKKPADQFVSLGTFEFRRGDQVDVAVHATDTTAVVIADAARMVFVGDEGFADTRKQMKALNQQIASIEKKLQGIKKAAAGRSQVITVQEEKDPGDFHVCIRGNVRNLGRKVPRGFLSVAAAEPAQIPATASGRLQLARWVASKDNPLTARVAVNRIWHHLFGSGLVRTVDNFGVPGEKPSNRQLLDHLAIRFEQNGWSTKKLIREIVLSRTYQQSSAADPSAIAADPENRLFARQNLRRLEAESLRDALFSLSGQLDLKPADDTVRKGTKTEYGYKFNSRRRSVYLPVFRNRLHPLFAVFDFPDPNLSNGRRNVSTLSTQALYLMNSPVVVEQATKTARLLLTKKANDAERLEFLYEKAIGRLPTSSEAELAMSFLKDVDQNEQTEQWAAICQAVIGSVDFRYVR